MSKKVERKTFANISIFCWLAELELELELEVEVESC